MVETHSGLATTLASDWLDNIIGDTPMRDEADHAAHLVRGVLETAILHIATPAAEPPAKNDREIGDAWARACVQETLTPESDRRL